MRKERISYSKRFALWKAHQGRCPYCGRPVRFLDMQVEHILPEWLTSDLGRLSRVKEEYGLDDTFDLRDYCNLLPTHAGCNRQKGTDVPGRSVALFHISLAAGKAVQAKAEENRYIRAREADRAVGKVLAAVEQGVLTIEKVLATAATLPEPVRATFDPIVVCFGLSVDEVLDSRALPRDVPTQYPWLCDWLEADLLNRAQRAFKSPCYYAEASARAGEMLSVRLALVKPELDVLAEADWAWWQILQVEYYSVLYGPQGLHELGNAEVR